MDLVKDVKNLLKGLGITGKHLGRHAITIQYPEERWTMPERSRGMVVLLSDKETGGHNCTGCELCAKACPTGALLVEAPRDDNKQKWLKAFRLDIGLCCFCGLCEEACNFSALRLATKYEFSVLDKEELIWDFDKLLEVGRDVPYEDTRKVKKPAPLAPNTGKPREPKKPASDKARDVAKSQTDAAKKPVPDTSRQPGVEQKPDADGEKKPEADAEKPAIEEDGQSQVATDSPSKPDKDKQPPNDANQAGEGTKEQNTTAPDSIPGETKDSNSDEEPKK